MTTIPTRTPTDYETRKRKLLSAFAGTVEPPRRTLAHIVAFVPAALALILLPLALAKALLLKRRPGAARIVLDPRQEPLLFDLVERIARLIAVPAPASIAVTRGDDASVRRSRRGYDLDLGVGLIAALETRQLAAVIAHECARVAETSWPVAWALDRLARPLTVPLVREIEHAADRRAARLAGSGVVAAALKRRHPRGDALRLEARIANAAREGALGVFQAAGPATAVFRDFDALAARPTAG
jgi:hypothetical protein